MNCAATVTLVLFLILASAVIAFLIWLYVTRPRRPRLVIRVGIPEKQPFTKGRKTMFTASIKADEQVTVTVEGATDRKGNPAPLDGPPTFTSADESICTFTTDPRDASGMTGLIVAVGPLTSATAVSITADAKIGPEVKEITENGLVEISAGEATGFSVKVGTPEPQP